jgi:purine-binding chemotaxis protein CheW
MISRDVERILADRARLLAAPDDGKGRATEELATFSIGGHAFAVPLADVTHGATLQHLTEIPGGPSWLVGLTAVDGALVSLLHLPLFLGLERQGVSDITGALVVAADGREIGLAAGQLLGIEDVPRDEIVEMPVPLAAITRVARSSRKEELLLLDVPSLFADPRLGRDRR